MIVDFVSKYFYYIFLGLILLTVIQRKYRGVGDKKRFAVLLISIMFFLMYIGALGIKSKNLEQYWLLLPFLIDLSLIYVLRSRLFIFKTECLTCGKKLSTQDMLYIDSNLCSSCTETAEAAEEGEVKAESPETDSDDESDS